MASQYREQPFDYIARPRPLEATAVGLDGTVIRANVSVKPGETALVTLGE